ncbi:MAG: hypothetical protein U5O15_07830 [Candidatus Krumholzibacteriota bacterium]|nr:hypothetical protein [Candidatus Krumholzibacteriota bacterium]
MHVKSFFMDFVITFITTLVAAVVVTFLWNLIGNGSGSVDWATSFRLAIILGATMAIVNRRK